MKSKWKTFLLNDFAESIRGVSYKPHELLKGYECDAVTLLRSTNIQNHVLTFNELQFVPRTIVGEKQLCKYKDTIMCMSNGSKALVGKTAQFKFESQNFTCGSFCSILRSHEEKNANFVFVLVNSDSFLKQLDVTLSGSAINNLQNSQVDKFNFVLPEEIQERQHIADILTSCDDVIEQTEKAIAKYQAIKTGMLQDLFTRGVDANGKLRPTPEDAPELYKDSPLGKIPKEWDFCKVKDYGEIVTGNTPSTARRENWGGEIPFYSPVDFSDMAYCLNTERTITEQGLISGRMIPQNSIMVVCIASIGKIAISKKAGITNQQINTIIPNGKFNYEYLYYLLLFHSWKLQGYAPKTSVPIINKEDFSCFEFPVTANIEEQQIIFRKLSKIDKKITIEKQTLQKYIAIKQGLMKKLLTPPEGALEV